MAKRGSTVKSNRTQLPYLVAVVVLVVLIFFSLVRPVGGQYAEDTKKCKWMLCHDPVSVAVADRCCLDNLQMHRSWREIRRGLSKHLRDTPT